MQCLKTLFMRNHTYFSKILLITSIILLIGNILIIMFIFIILLKLKIFIQLYLLFLLIYSLIFISFIIALEYFNKKNIIFTNKKNYTILSSYLFLIINIILISVLFGELFNEYNNDNENLIYKKCKIYIIDIIIILIFILFILLFNILFFQTYKFFNEENNNNNENDSIHSKTTDCGDSDRSINISLNEIINDKIYFQNNIFDYLTKITCDSYSQTI